MSPWSWELSPHTAAWAAEVKGGTDPLGFTLEQRDTRHDRCGGCGQRELSTLWPRAAAESVVRAVCLTSLPAPFFPSLPPPGPSCL